MIPFCMSNSISKAIFKTKIRKDHLVSFSQILPRSTYRSHPSHHTLCLKPFNNLEHKRSEIQDASSYLHYTLCDRLPCWLRKALYGALSIWKEWYVKGTWQGYVQLKGSSAAWVVNFETGMWGEMEVRKYMDCQPTRENSQGTKVAESLVGLYWGWVHVLWATLPGQEEFLTWSRCSLGKNRKTH